MRIFFALCVCLILIGCATTGYVVPYFVQPPERYSHTVPHTIIEYTSMAEVNQICNDLLSEEENYEEGSFVGCAIEGEVCQIHALQAWHISFPSLIRHEMGHCAGWPSDHPR